MKNWTGYDMTRRCANGHTFDMLCNASFYGAPPISTLSKQLLFHTDHCGLAFGHSKRDATCGKARNFEHWVNCVMDAFHHEITEKNMDM